MSYNFIECDRETLYLMPPSLREWLPEGELAWFMLDVVGEMDLSKFYGRYRADGCGHAAYEPGMMVSLLLYAYCLGTRSSRQIERLCGVDVGFRLIAANQRPDYTTICRFRSENEAELQRLFTEALRLCVEAGLVKVGVVALDGTKIKAAAALSANRTHESLEKEVEKMLAEAKAKDAEEDALYGADKRGDELPEDLRDRKSRLRRLQEAKARLDREAAAQAAEQAAKISLREAEEETTGKKKRGRKPGEPDANPQEDAKANVTDPESRIMKTRSGHVQGYNAQAVVTKEQVIVAAEVTQQANDVKQLNSMLEKAKEELRAAGEEEEIGKALADAGYWSDANVREADPNGPELLIATNKDWKQRKAMREQAPPRGRIPTDCSARERMERKLLTARGRKLYKLSSQTVEPVFGQMKDGRGCDRFMRRGVSAAAGEWALICATHNLLKLWRSGKAKLGRVVKQISLGRRDFVPAYA